MLTPVACDLTPGRPLQVARGVRRLVAGNPGPLTGPGTNSYLIGTRELVILDPGPALPAHTEAILAAVGSATVVAIVVTHTHLDHSPGARELQRRCAAPLWGSPARHPVHQDATFSPTRGVGDGDTLDCDAGPLVAVATPGHASNHVCWYQPAARLLYTGDHILGTTSPVILPPDGDMTEYLDSLARLAALSLALLLPGHGPPLTEPQAVIESLTRHRLAREARVAAALAVGSPVSLDALLPIAYADVDPSLYPWARRTLEAHLIRLERTGRARRVGAGWAPA